MTSIYSWRLCQCYNITSNFPVLIGRLGWNARWCLQARLLYADSAILGCLLSSATVAFICTYFSTLIISYLLGNGRGRGGDRGVGGMGEFQSIYKYIYMFWGFTSLKIFFFKIPAYDILFGSFKWPVRAYKFDYFCHQCQTVSFRGSVLKPGLIEFHIGRFNNQFLDDITLHISALIPSCSWLVGGELINAPTESPNSSGD